MKSLFVSSDNCDIKDLVWKEGKYDEPLQEVQGVLPTTNRAKFLFIVSDVKFTKHAILDYGVWKAGYKDYAIALETQVHSTLHSSFSCLIHSAKTSLKIKSTKIKYW